jgi:hypothetical protein
MANLTMHMDVDLGVGQNKHKCTIQIPTEQVSLCKEIYSHPLHDICLVSVQAIRNQKVPFR